MKLAAISSLVSCTLVSQAFAGDVFVVSTVGPYTTIQSAINAASDYDTILVKQSTYGSFTVTNKSLAIVGDAVAFVNGESRVTALSADKICLLAGLNANAASATTFALRTSGNLGTIRIEQCTIQGAQNDPWPFGGHAVEIGVDNDVKLVACTVTGAQLNYNHADGGTALKSAAVFLELVRCTLTGGNGRDGFGDNGFNGGDGGHGLNVVGGIVQMTRSTAAGGHAGAGEWGEKPGGVLDPNCSHGGAGGNGGHGILVGSPQASALVKLRESSSQGGSGASGGGAWSPCAPGPDGPPGSPVFLLNGTTATLVSPARTVSGGTIARESFPVVLQITGAPGDRVYALITQADAEPIVGTSTHAGLGVSSLRGDGQFLGTVPASGTLVKALPTRMLPGGVQSRWWKLEPAFVGLNGFWHRGNDFYYVVVDSAF